jgi:glycosyltransferase involved in cell wall biosynthesis
MPRHLRIAQVAPPLVPVPPVAYGGTERIVGELVRELQERGHDVTTFASGDSTVPGRLIPTVPTALWPAGFSGDPAPWLMSTVATVLEHAASFDVIHSHLEWFSPLLARMSPVPVVTTFHGRLDVPWALRLTDLAPGAAWVAISRAQAAGQPAVPWAGVVHNGLTLTESPFESRHGEDLAFVGRLSPEKGAEHAIEIAMRTGRRLRVAAKSGKSPIERDYLESVFRPALAAAGSAVEWLGELPRVDRDRLLTESRALLMPGDWPEPFGLVAIESMACGTPVVARRAGALPEIVRDGVDGILGDDLDALVCGVDEVVALDRGEIRRSVLDRFAPGRMADAYETVYRSVARPPDGGPAILAGPGRGTRWGRVVRPSGEGVGGPASGGRSPG